jgi:hypothetical protein
MTPPRILEQALRSGLGWIGIADHNATENLGAFHAAAASAGVAFSPGIEITTAEEIHVLTFFDGLDAAAEMGAYVGKHLGGRNDERVFGRQVIVDVRGEELGTREDLLIGATDLGVGEVVAAARGLGGLVIAAHVDRPSYSIVSQLGFVPAELALDAAELSVRASGATQAAAWRGRLGMPLVWFSDAHRPEDVGAAATRATVAAPTIRELARALLGLEARGVGPA